jgi:hypothetical protein
MPARNMPRCDNKESGIIKYSYMQCNQQHQLISHAHLDLVVVGLWSAHAGVVCEIWLDEMRKLRVDVERIRNLWYVRDFLFFLLALPETLLLWLAGGCPRVDGGCWPVGPGLCGRRAVVARKDRLTSVAKYTQWAKVELRETVRVVLWVCRGHLRGTAVDGGCAHAHGRRAADVAARGAAARVVRVNGEGFVLGIILRFGIDFRKGHGATGADTTGSDVA